MHRVAFVLALALIAGAAAHGQTGPDLMKTPECLSARQQLEAVLAAGGPRDRLDTVRRQAALKCLGVEAPPRPESRSAPPPAALDPIRLRSEPALRPPAAPAAPPSVPLAPPGPAVITSCDAAGCWDSNGVRYQQQGPVLVGPRGLCTRQNGLLNCP